MFLCFLSVENQKVILIALMHFVDAFQVFHEVFDVVFISEMNLEMYSGLLQFWEEEFENNQHKEIECIDVNEHWFKTVNIEWKLKTVVVLYIIMKMWNDWIQVMKIMKFQWKQWKYSTCCHHLFPSGADVIQMDGRDTFIDGIEIITQCQLFQIQEEGKFGKVLLFWSIRSCGRDDRWFNCGRLWLNEMICELFVNNGIDLGNEWFSDDVFVTLRCERESLGKEEVNLFGLEWVLCWYGGRGLPVGTTGHPLVTNITK